MRQTAEPMNPAPPVTAIFMTDTTRGGPDTRKRAVSRAKPPVILALAAFRRPSQECLEMALTLPRGRALPPASIRRALATNMTLGS